VASETDRLELVLQVLAYAGVGGLVLIVGFIAMDLVTAGNLREMVREGRPNAVVLSAATLASLGLVVFFAIYYTGGGWDGLIDAAIFGAVGVMTQAVLVVVVDTLLLGRVPELWTDTRLRPTVFVPAAAQFAGALIVSASLT
jgi:uncharacterized membrane protein YjfL (UPF0719 family)